jgi:hypothetical protein
VSSDRVTKTPTAVDLPPDFQESEPRRNADEEDVGPVSEMAAERILLHGVSDNGVRVTAGSPERYCKGVRGLES